MDVRFSNMSWSSWMLGSGKHELVVTETDTEKTLPWRMGNQYGCDLIRSPGALDLAATITSILI